MSAILWILSVVAPWCDLPERFGKWTTVYSRFCRWQRTGVWTSVFAKLQTLSDAKGTLDWSLHFVDGTVVRAPQHAAGAKTGGGTQALG